MTERIIPAQCTYVAFVVIMNKLTVECALSQLHPRVCIQYIYVRVYLVPLFPSLSMYVLNMAPTVIPITLHCHPLVPLCTVALCLNLNGLVIPRASCTHRTVWYYRIDTRYCGAMNTRCAAEHSSYSASKCDQYNMVFFIIHFLDCLQGFFSQWLMDRVPLLLNSTCVHHQITETVLPLHSMFTAADGKP